MAPFKLSNLLHHNKQDSERRSSTSTTHSTRSPSPGPNSNDVPLDPSTSSINNTIVADQSGQPRASPADVYKHQVVSQQIQQNQAVPQTYAGLPTTQRQGATSSSGIGYQLSNNPDDGMRINTSNIASIDDSQSPTPTQANTIISGPAK
jgi:hypothetical protein